MSKELLRGVDVKDWLPGIRALMLTGREQKPSTTGSRPSTPGSRSSTTGPKPIPRKVLEELIRSDPTLRFWTNLTGMVGLPKSKRLFILGEPTPNGLAIGRRVELVPGFQVGVLVHEGNPDLLSKVLESPPTLYRGGRFGAEQEGFQIVSVPAGLQQGPGIQDVKIFGGRLLLMYWTAGMGFVIAEYPAVRSWVDIPVVFVSESVVNRGEDEKIPQLPKPAYLAAQLLRRGRKEWEEWMGLVSKTQSSTVLVYPGVWRLRCDLWSFPPNWVRMIDGKITGGSLAGILTLEDTVQLFKEQAELASMALKTWRFGA